MAYLSTHSVVAAVFLLLALLALPATDGAFVAPNELLGQCLTPEWVRSIETKLGISTSDRDAQGRLIHPHLRAALGHVRFRLDDARTSETPVEQLYLESCFVGKKAFYGAGAQVNPSDGTITNRGTVNGTLVLELKGWATHALATNVMAIIAREVVGYGVSMFKTSDAAYMPQRLASVRAGRCAPIHLNVEVWGTVETTYANESYRVGGIGYFGRSGLYTTTKFVEDGTDVSKYNPSFDADFWRDYRSNEKLMEALDVHQLKNNTRFYPPAELPCNDGTLGCKDHCSKTDTCAAREAQGKSCLVVLMMYPYYDTGYFEAVLANNKIPSYHCFLGYDPTQTYALEAFANNTPAVFYHYEPDPFHVVHEGKFSRVFLPRTRPDLSALASQSFGENGYGGKTTNPVSVDYPNSNLGKYANSAVQNEPILASLVSRISLSELDINSLLKMYVNITTNGGLEPLFPDDPYFSAACQWVRDNYPVWRLWLERLPLAATVFYIFLALALLVCTALVMAMMLAPKVLRLHDKATDPTTTSQANSTSNGDTETGVAPKKRSLLRLPVRASKSQVTPVQVFTSSAGSKASKRSKRLKKKKQKKAESHQSTSVRESNDELSSSSDD
ncbi:hypothetical protein ATCC90586_006841 [Pythium insidiosum]|nr:hypothetical protein ATCC90586_006841 [Pythium insidiosum]